MTVICGSFSPMAQWQQPQPPRRQLHHQLRHQRLQPPQLLRQQPRRQRVEVTADQAAAVTALMTCRCFSVLKKWVTMTMNLDYWAMLITNKERTSLMSLC